jgi:Prokaryotic N-terminal methylation motif
LRGALEKAGFMKNLRRHSGISLVEALAALVILSLGAAVALTWFIGSADRVARLREEETLLLNQLSAMDFMRSINPVERPQGQILLAGQQITWRSQVVSGPVRSMNKQGGEGPFELTLHQVQVTLERSAGNPNIAPAAQPLSFELKLAGYRSMAGAGGVGAIFGSTR